MFQGQSGQWVDAGFGQGPLNSQGLQWQPGPSGQPPTTTGGGGTGFGHQNPPAPAPTLGGPPVQIGGQRPTPTMGGPPSQIGGPPAQIAPPGQMMPPQGMKSSPYDGMRLQQVTGARRPGKY